MRKTDVNCFINIFPNVNGIPFFYCLAQFWSYLSVVKSLAISFSTELSRASPLSSLNGSAKATASTKPTRDKDINVFISKPSLRCFGWNIQTAAFISLDGTYLDELYPVIGLADYFYQSMKLEDCNVKYLFNLMPYCMFSYLWKMTLKSIKRRNQFSHPVTLNLLQPVLRFFYLTCDRLFSFWKRD